MHTRRPHPSPAWRVVHRIDVPLVVATGSGFAGGMDTTGGRPIVVIGASGGVGTSTLALAVGRRVADTHGPSVVLDLDPSRGGLEVTAGIEHLAGHRWEALRAVRGRAPASEILARLPEEGGCHVLSGGGAGPRSPGGVPEEVVLDVLASLRGCRATVILDLPGTSALLPAVVADGARIVLLVAMHTRGFADADAVVERLLDALPEGARTPDLALVTRGGRLHPQVLDDLVHHLGAPHLHHLPDDPRVRQGSERGLWPGTARDAVRSCADAVVKGFLTEEFSLGRAAS